MRLSFLRGTGKMRLLVLFSLAVILIATGIYAFQLVLRDITPITLNTKLNASMVYYGVHVPGQPDTLTQLNAFENDARKPASIVMWYQGWGVSDYHDTLRQVG